MRWVFLRGLLRESRHWGAFPALFAARLGLQAHDVLPLDFPGIGTEAGRVFPLSMAALVDELRSRIRLRPGEKVALFAMSLGAMCALEWAERFPDEIAGIVLVNASAADLAPWHQRLSLPALRSFAKIARTAGAFERENLILGLTSNLRRASASTAREWAEYSLPLSRLVAVGMRQLWVALRFQAPSRLRVPALILSSARDRLAHPISSAVLAERYGQASGIHPDAGHDLILDDPEWVIRRTLDWVRRLPA